MAAIGLFLKKLSKREKLFLLGGSALIGFIAVYLYFIEPIRERVIKLNQLIPQKEQDLHTFNDLSKEYLFLSTQIKNIENRIPQKNQFSPLSYLENIAKQNRVREQIVYIRSMTPVSQVAYQEIPLEVKMEDIPLSRIVPYLAAIENAPYLLRVKRLSMKTRFEDAEKLDVTFIVSSYEKM